jgi:septal ring factor EnvC (AmiA/AmiB activator)
MAEVGGITEVNRLWTVTLLVGVAAIFGWGALAYTANFSAIAQQQLRDQVAEMTASRDQRQAERDQARAQLRAAREEMTTLRGTLGQTNAEHEELKVKLKAARHELASIQSPIGEGQVRETGSLQTPKATPSRANTKRR